MITELEFKSLQTQDFNRIPLVAEAFAYLETPLSLYLQLAHSKNQGKHSFLLESVVGGERFGRQAHQQHRRHRGGVEPRVGDHAQRASLRPACARLQEDQVHQL